MKKVTLIFGVFRPMYHINCSYDELVLYSDDDDDGGGSGGYLVVIVKHMI